MGAGEAMAPAASGRGVQVPPHPALAAAHQDPPQGHGRAGWPGDSPPQAAQHPRGEGLGDFVAEREQINTA